MPDASSPNVEIAALNGDTVLPSCFVPMPFPMKLQDYAVGTIERDYILLCGGEDDTG